MNFKIKSNSTLKQATSILSGVANGSCMPLLENVKIELKPERLITITATDSKTFCKFILTAENSFDKTGDFTLPAKKFCEIVSLSGEGELIEVDADDRRATIKFWSSVYRLACLPSENFPRFPRIEPDTKNWMNIRDVKAFKSAVDSVSLAVANLDPRKVLHGILIEVDKEKLTAGFTGTDGKKLAHYEIEAVETSDLLKNNKVIVPLKPIQDFAKHLDPKSTEGIFAGWEENLISFESDNFIVSTPLIARTYPNYKNVIPKDCDKVAGVNVKNLLSAISKAAITSDEKAYAALLKFDSETGKLTVSSNCRDVGEFATSFDITYAKEQTQAAFNIKTLRELIGHFKDGDVQLDFKSGESPFIIHRYDSMSPMFLLMPIKMIDLPSAESEEAKC